MIAIDSMLNRMANYTSQLQAISERAINAQEEERVRGAPGKAKRKAVGVVRRQRERKRAREAESQLATWMPFVM